VYDEVTDTCAAREGNKLEKSMNTELMCLTKEWTKEVPGNYNKFNRCEKKIYILYKKVKNFFYLNNKKIINII
jgi:hypothetical protein